MKRGGPSHPKTFALAEALGIPRAHAVGLLELLFHFTAQYCPAGDVGRFEDKRIAAALDWRGSADKLVGALASAGWLDPHPAARLVVHDWAEHADRTVVQRMRRAGKTMIQSREQDSGELCTQIETTGEQKNALPEPEPEARARSQKPEPHARGGGAPLAVCAPANQNARWRSDEGFHAFREAYAETGKPLIDSDWADTHFDWRMLDFEQKRAAVEGVRARVEAKVWNDPQYVPLPKNYLQKREWQRMLPVRQTEADRIAAL